MSGNKRVQPKLKSIIYQNDSSNGEFSNLNISDQDSANLFGYDRNSIKQDAGTNVNDIISQIKKEQSKKREKMLAIECILNLPKVLNFS